LFFNRAKKCWIGVGDGAGLWLLLVGFLNENADHEVEHWLVQQTWWRWERTEQELYQGHVDLQSEYNRTKFFFWICKCDLAFRMLLVETDREECPIVDLQLSFME
jgi:hypothetical protein